MTREIDQLAPLLFADDPRGKLQRIVSYLVREAEAQGGALLALEGEKLVPCVTQGLDLERLSGVRSLFDLARPTLEKGQMRLEGESIIAPVNHGSRLVGVLYLDKPRRFDEADTEMLRGLLARGLTTPLFPAALETFLSTMSPEDGTREQLTILLQRNEWNIARVARLLGVTRPTVYARLRRFGIERRRVPKILKTMAPA